jgi:uncharacterized membrane protein YhaH (DUF805 family)
MTTGQTLFGFNGRIRRLTYLGYTVLYYAVGLLLIYLSVAAGKSGSVAGEVILLVATTAGMIWVGLALTIKRLHDMALTGLHAIWIFLPNAAYGIRSLTPAQVKVLVFLNFGVIPWLAFTRGKDEPNLYGPPPNAALSPKPFAT